jgi:WXG100 family type VII secretion target
MLARIQANPVTLEQVATDLMRTADEIESERRRLAGTVNPTLGAWQSRFTQSYIHSVNITNSRIGSLAEDLRRQANFLRSAAAQVRQAEQRVQEIKRRLAGIR